MMMMAVVVMKRSHANHSPRGMSGWSLSQEEAWLGRWAGRVGVATPAGSAMETHRARAAGRRRGTAWP